MIDTSKIIHAPVGGARYTVTAPIVKEDYGLYLLIEGLELPQTYEVDFSNSEHNGTSVTMIGNSDGVLIPSQFISSGKDVFAFLYHVGVDYGKTIYKFRIPNKLRPDRTNQTPTPEEQSTIDQCISALNDAVTDAQGYAQEASDKADSIHAMTATATTLPEGSEATASYDAETGVMSFGIPVGATGAQGEQGVAGRDGTDGQDGQDGADGFSPTVSVTSITGGHEVSITDAQGTQSFNVMDGDDYILTEQDKDDIADIVTPRVANNKAPIITDTASGAIASFTDGADNIPLKELVVNIDPVQDLSNGDPSPTNICPISGWTGVNIYHEAEYDAQADPTLAISWQSEAGTVYGGKLDVLRGVMRVDKFLLINDGTLGSWNAGAGIPFWRRNPSSAQKPNYSKRAEIISNKYSKVTTGTSTDKAIRITSDNNGIYLYDSDFVDSETAISIMQASPVQIVYPLETPITYQLAPHEVASLLGQNNIFADAGNVSCEYRADTKLYINKKIAEAISALS